MCSRTGNRASVGIWRLLLAVCLVLVGQIAFAQAANAGWRQVFSDDFNRPVIGANWRWLFGSGRHYIVDNAIHI
ncbi:MAG TPA: hypothetical protein VGM23_10390, partial [Armatimonadota bacterium]